MADYTDLSSAFGAYTILPSANMQQLRDNIIACFEQSSGAPVLANFYTSSSMINSWAVTGTKIAEYCITSRHIINGSIGTVSIHADAITMGKLNQEIRPKMSKIILTDGTSANTIKAQMTSVQSGDAIGATDNIAKGSTTGDFTLSADGTTLRIEASGLSGNCNFVLACGPIYDRTDTHVINNYFAYANANDIVYEGVTDLPLKTDNDSSYIFWVTYFTDT